jgi:hypothetical protein
MSRRRDDRGGPSQRCRGGATKALTLRLAAVEAAELARELRIERCGLRVGGVQVLGLGAHRRLRWRLPERGRIEGTVGGGQFAGAKDVEGGGQSED